MASFKKPVAAVLLSLDGHRTPKWEKYILSNRAKKTCDVIWNNHTFISSTHMHKCARLSQ